MPTVGELAGTGYSPEDYEESAEIWPENWPVFRIFVSVQTQWIVGASGATGMNYPAVYPLLDRHFSGEEWEMALSDIRAMESSALAAMRSK